MLFNLIVDMLAVLIARAKEHEKIRGLVPHLVEGGISILQYANNDTIFFMENNLEEAKNLNLVLCAFENLSSLKINFHINELFCFSEASEIAQEYVALFECKEDNTPFRYSGIPMSPQKLSNKDCSGVEERFQTWLSSWKGKLLLVGGRLVLINSMLSSLSMLMMSFFRIPKGVLKKLDYYRSRFFWQGDGHKKYRLVKWSILCKPKSEGGLGITHLETQNICLLIKWLFKIMNEEGLCQEIV